MIEHLRRYTTIAWDFDGTICDHPDADRFHEFIRTNPFGQKHYIVTFRSHGEQDMIWETIRLYHPAPPELSHFVGVLNIPDRLFERFRFRFSMSPEDAEIADREYRHWKALMCKEIGAEVLIDDMMEHVYPGCEHHGIDYVHPSHLLILT